jgi:hypothetical protein
MAGQSRIYKLNILADTKGLTDGLNKANKQVTGASGGLSNAFNKVKLAAIAATAAGAAFAIKFGKDAIIAASDLSETLAKAGEIFGDSAKQIETFASTAAKSLGQSKQQAIDAAATFAVFGKSAGLAGDDLVKFSTDFTVLASDLASFNNTSPDEAITAIGAALRGEAEPLRRFGVLLDDATLRSAALELGIVSTTKNALTPQQKVLAAQEVIFRQTADAQGDFARTSDGLANSQRILAAQLDNVKVTIGTALLPIATELFASFSKRLIPAVENFASTFRDDLVPYIERRVLPAFKDLKDSIFGIGEALKLTNNDLEEASVLTTAFKMTVRDFVPETIKGFADVAKAFATLVDVLRRGIAFLQGDFDTALAKFENRFKTTNDEINNVNRSMVNAQKQFQFFNSQNKSDTIPTTTETTRSLTNATVATTGLAAATRGAAEAVKSLSAVQRELNALQAGGAIPSAISPDQAAFFRSELSLIRDFGGFIEGINLLPTDPFFGFGQGSSVNKALQQRAGGSATATGGVVNINVSGAVIDPEGAARAIEQLIADSNARGGALVSDLFGINP